MAFLAQEYLRGYYKMVDFVPALGWQISQPVIPIALPSPTVLIYN
jgi:hypothetical protein